MGVAHFTNCIYCLQIICKIIRNLIIIELLSFKFLGWKQHNNKINVMHETSQKHKGVTLSHTHVINKYCTNNENVVLYNATPII